MAMGMAIIPRATIARITDSNAIEITRRTRSCAAIIMRLRRATAGVMAAGRAFAGI